MWSPDFVAADAGAAAGAGVAAGAAAGGVAAGAAEGAVAGAWAKDPFAAVIAVNTANATDVHFIGQLRDGGMRDSRTAQALSARRRNSARQRVQ